MNQEVLFDISEQVEQAALERWKKVVLPNPTEYLVSSLQKWGEGSTRAEAIQPLWSRVIRSAYENGPSEGERARELRLLGSFAALDAVADELQSRGEPMVVTPEDNMAYRKFSDDFLVDSRWRQMTEVRDGMEIVKPEFIDDYVALMRVTGGPSVDVSILVEILEERGRHRLINAMRECGQMLANPMDSRANEPVKQVFMRGVWTVVPTFAIKYGGKALERLLTEKRVEETRLN